MKDQSVGIRELRNKLSAYIRRVRNGETILVTDRGQVVAELRPAEPAYPEGPTGSSGLMQGVREGQAVYDLERAKAARKVLLDLPLSGSGLSWEKIQQDLDESRADSPILDEIFGAVDESSLKEGPRRDGESNASEADNSA